MYFIKLIVHLENGNPDLIRFFLIASVYCPNRLDTPYETPRLEQRFTFDPSMERHSIFRWTLTVYSMLIRVDGSPGFAQCKALSR